MRCTGVLRFLDWKDAGVITALAPEYTVVKHRTVRRGDQTRELTIFSLDDRKCFTLRL